MNLTPEQVDANRSAVRASGDRTIQQYQDWMQTNAAAHLMRAARQSGVVDQLRQRQHTLEELCETLSLDSATTKLLVEGLVAIGFLEQYEDDFALARAGHLLCQYDQDLGDECWGRLHERLQAGGDSESAAQDSAGSATEPDVAQYRNRLAATQWIHTAAAMQAAEILNIGGEDSPRGIRILDLGCGSAVWSCAMAHRDADSTIVAVDEAGALTAARSNAESIGLGDRLKTIQGDPVSVTTAEANFDLVVMAQLLSAYSDAQAADLLRKASSALKPGGRIVAPDFYVGPGRAGLKESISRLWIHLATESGRVRDLRHCQQMLIDAGLGAIQFTYLAASEAGLGMLVAEKT